MDARVSKSITHTRHEAFALTVLLTPDGTVVRINREVLEAAGIRASEVIGRKLWDTFWWNDSAERQAQLREAIERVAGGQIARLAVSLPRGPQRRAAVNLQLVPLHDEAGNVMHLVLSPNNPATSTPPTTELRAAEERLRALSEEALRAANEQFHKSDRRKTEFLAILGHELRNPLASIRNAVALLRLRSAPDPNLQSVREMIDRQVAHMVRLIDDLLDVSRINRGKLELRKERVAVAAIVNQAIEISRPHLHHDLTVLLPPEPIYLDADPMRLAQVFSNLIHNAAKFTERGGRISLTAERHGDELTVTVQDEGIGISAEQLPGLFEIFAQAAPALERAQGGLGIGLALSRGLVEIHGGRIEARSEGLGKGSEFIVHLPLAKTAIAQPADAEKGWAEATVTAQRCLVADDNHDAANSLAMLLRLDGNEVEIARDGIEAVEKAKLYTPQFILLDIGMPRMNGYDACRAIRSLPAGRNMTIIALTGWGQEEDRRKAMEAGFDNHLTKPVDYSALRDLLASLSKGQMPH